MNHQQLQIARAALWRQNANPLVTFDEAAAWLQEMGFCLFLPCHAQLPAPAPSFVEACGGHVSVMPGAGEIEQAFSLAARLAGQGEAVPLNLLGNVSEQPDFLATPEVLPWLAGAHGDRNWKAAPGGRTAPVVVRTWEVLARDPGRTAAEIREVVGREVTEATVLRALVELWTTLRAVPDYAPGEPARWSLMRKQWAGELARGASTAQSTALSVLISVYLRSAIAATGEEIEIYLSPLTSRSRIREVVHGMMATRQLGTMALGVDTLLYIEGSLPEVEQPAEEGTQAEVAAPRPPAEERQSGPEFRKPRPERRKVTQEQRARSAPAKRPWQKFPPREDRGAPGRVGKARFERGERKQGFAAHETSEPGKERQFGKPAPWQERRGGKDWQRPRRAGAERPAARPQFGDRTREAGEMRGPERGERQRRAPFSRQGEGRPSGGFRGRRKPFDGSRPEERGGFRGKPQGEDRGSSNRREQRPERPDRAGFQAPGKNRPARGREEFEKKSGRGTNAGRPRLGGPARRFEPPRRGGAPRKDGFAGGGRSTNRGSDHQQPGRREPGQKKSRKREKEKPE